MTPRQLDYLMPGDRVYPKGHRGEYEVEGIVLYLTADDQVIDAVKLRGLGMLQREEMLKCYRVVTPRKK